MVAITFHETVLEATTANSNKEGGCDTPAYQINHKITLIWACWESGFKLGVNSTNITMTREKNIPLH